MFGAGIKMSTGEIVHRGLRYELMPVSMLISAVVSFCPRVRRPPGLDSSVSGTVSKCVVPDLFRKIPQQEKRGTFPLTVCENKRAEIDGALVGKGNIF